MRKFMNDSFLRQQVFLFGILTSVISFVFIIPIVKNNYEEIMVEKNSTIQFFIGVAFLLISLIIFTITTIYEKEGKKKIKRY